MKQRVAIFIILILMFTLVGCSDKPNAETPTNDNTQVSTPSTEEVDTATNESDDSHDSQLTDDQTTPNDSDTSDSNPETSPNDSEDQTGSTEDAYETSRVALEGYANVTGEYLSVSGISSTISQDYVNQTLKASVINMLGQDISEMNPIVIKPLVMTQSPTLLSVIYVGTIEWENGSMEIWNPSNIDLTTTDEITVSNLVKSDFKSKEAFNTIFSAKALEAGFEFESPEDWMGMYFENGNLVYFFKENDFADQYVQVIIPVEDIKAYINYNL